MSQHLLAKIKLHGTSLIFLVAAFCGGNAVAIMVAPSSATCQTTAKRGTPIDCDESVECNDSSDSCHRAETGDWWSGGVHHREYTCVCFETDPQTCTAHDEWIYDPGHIPGGWQFGGTYCGGPCGAPTLCKELGAFCSCQ
jgi:hypothetical protein